MEHTIHLPLWQDRRWLVGLGCLGILAAVLIALLGAGPEPLAGAGPALMLVLLPLLAITTVRYPLALFQLCGLILILNCFGFLTPEALYFRGVAGALILLMVLRLGRIDWQPLRWFLGAFALVCLASVVSVGFHPEAEVIAIGIIWLLPVAMFAVGYALQRDYPEQFETHWQSLFVLGGLLLALINFGQWVGAGAQFRSYTLTGAFLNANVTAAMQAFFLPFYLALMADRRGALRLIGGASLLLTSGALFVSFSRFAWAMVLMAPFLTWTRRYPGIAVLFLAFLLGYGLFNAGVLAAGGVNPLTNPVAAQAAQSVRMGGKGEDDIRWIGYGVSWIFGVQPHMMEGIGFGGGRDLFIRFAIDSYGPENLFLQTWLEGGLIVLIPMLVLWVMFNWLCARVVFWPSHRIDPFTYALGLSGLMVFCYDNANSTQSHMSLRALYACALGALFLRLLWIRRGWIPGTAPPALSAPVLPLVEFKKKPAR